MTLQLISRFVSATMESYNNNTTVPEQQQVDIPSPVSPSGFQWPASEPPSATNLSLAESLCKSFVPSAIITKDTAVLVSPCHHIGWSAQDCIKVTFTTGQGHGCRCISFMVKIPRQCTPGSAATCCLEGIRAKWAAEAGLGPDVLVIDEATGSFVMAFVEGEALTTGMAARYAERIVATLLRKMHDGRQQKWMERYDPLAVVSDMLLLAKRLKTMDPEDVKLVERVIEKARQVGEDQSIDLMPCHNDFHSFNVMMDKDGRLCCIDFEDMNLADPMWDLAYFTANLELAPLGLADTYGCTDAERARLEALYPLAISHFATWAATRGPQWTQHVEDCLQRLRIGYAMTDD